MWLGESEIIQGSFLEETAGKSAGVSEALLVSEHAALGGLEKGLLLEGPAPKCTHAGKIRVNL